MAGSTAVLFRAGAGANIGTVTMWAMRKRNQPRITFIQLVYQITQHGFMVPKPRHTRVLHRIQMRKATGYQSGNGIKPEGELFSVCIILSSMIINSLGG